MLHFTTLSLFKGLGAARLNVPENKITQEKICSGIPGACLGFLGRGFHQKVGPKRRGLGAQPPDADKT